MQINSFPPITRPIKFEKLHSKYNVSKEWLGEGAYGTVYAGEDKITRKSVAIKKIKDFTTDPVEAKRLLREISLLRMLKEHPNIISLEYVAASTTQATFDEVWLVFERYDTNLDSIINSSQCLSMHHLQYFLYQILCGVYYIHLAKLVHRDLKPSNILVNSDCSIKICDFGLARAIQVPKDANRPDNATNPALFHQLTGYVVTRWYRSPELILGCRGTESVDMWSIGCILAELFLRTPLFPENTSLLVLSLILKLTGTPEEHEREWIDNKRGGLDYINRIPASPRQNFQEKFKKADPASLDLLEKLLEFNPTKRITAEKALQHSFISSRFGIKEMLTFPIRPASPIDESSLKDYYQFESELDCPSSNKSQTELTQWTCGLIQKEIARYSPEPISPADDDSSSLIAAYSLFSIQSKDQSVEAPSSHPHDAHINNNVIFK